jgi:hypothetical protein
MKATADIKNVPEQGNITGGSWLDAVRQQADSLNFELVQIVVRDARVVRIERSKKIRLENPIAVSGSKD